MYDPNVLRNLSFRSAAALVLEVRASELKPNPFYLYAQHIKRLNVFFGDMKVKDIHIGPIKCYQQERTVNEGEKWPRPCGASCLNHELSVMQGILKRAGQMGDRGWVSEWEKIAPHYRPLRMPAPTSPKVLSDTEEMMVFDIASRNPDWQLAYWVASITCNTGASGTELRNIQLHELHLDARVPFFTIKPETAKNNGRARPIVLNATAGKQLNRCLLRCATLGGNKPEHYLFPLRTSPGRWNPNRPASDSWLRRSFSELRDATGLTWLTPHCFRHQHATLRIESGDPIEIVALDMGHSATAMTRRYVHTGIHRDRQLVSVNKIDPSVRFGPSKQGVETRNSVAAK